VGGEVQEARLIKSVPPVYPRLAKANHVTGDVALDALIDNRGNVTDVKVVSGPTLLREAAMDALRSWKYEPARLDGRAVAAHLSITVKFRFQ
jgi:protein TonB